MKTKIPLLIDFDGVIKLGDKVAPDAKDFFLYIDKEQIPSCILSNSTLRTANLIKEFLKNKGIELKIPAFTAFDATVEYVKNHYSKVKVYCRDYLLLHFNDILEENNPEAIVIGDIGERWNYETMNEIFRYVINGAEIIAMHKNKYWQPEGELILDAGAFINAIEYASGKEAIIIGKPSPIYFQIALEKIGYKTNTMFFMLGDDIENDINAAQLVGGKGILILTGKTKEEVIKKYKPDYIAHSLSDVINLLNNIET